MDHLKTKETDMDMKEKERLEYVRLKQKFEPDNTVAYIKVSDIVYKSVKNYSINHIDIEDIFNDKFTINEVTKEVFVYSDNNTDCINRKIKSYDGNDAIFFSYGDIEKLNIELRDTNCVLDTLLRMKTLYKKQIINNIREIKRIQNKIEITKNKISEYNKNE